MYGLLMPGQDQMAPDIKAAVMMTRRTLRVCRCCLGRAVKLQNKRGVPGRPSRYHSNLTFLGFICRASHCCIGDLYRVVCIAYTHIRDLLFASTRYHAIPLCIFDGLNSLTRSDCPLQIFSSDLISGLHVDHPLFIFFLNNFLLYRWSYWAMQTRSCSISARDSEKGGCFPRHCPRTRRSDRGSVGRRMLPLLMSSLR
jgi:hypothetical protein